MRCDVRNEVAKFKREEIDLLNKSELARRMGCNRRTVDKYITETTVAPIKREYTSVLDDYKAIIIYKVDTYGSHAMAVFKFIQKRGFTGKYGIVAKYVKDHKKVQTQIATIRFETIPGLQAQVDWKEELKMVNCHGEIFNVNIFLMVLGYSRKKFLKLTVDRTQKTLFGCLVGAFSAYGGVPHELLFDNMSTVVDRNNSTFKSVAINKTFKYFADDAGFSTITCRPYRPQTKGKVESLARLVDRLTPYNGEFETYEDLEKITYDFMLEINNEVSQATNEVSNIRYEREKEYLKPLPPMDCLSSYISVEKEYKVSTESMVRYKGQKYSVSTKYIGQSLTIKEDDDCVQIYYNEDLIESHPKSKKIFNYKPDHVREILKSDALKHYTDDQIDKFIAENLSAMDLLLE